jgi:hypothetical protein
VFFLCFASVDNAILLTLSFIDMKHQVLNIRETLFKCLKEFPMRDELGKLERYLNYRFERHLNSFLINGVSFDALVFVVSKVFEKGTIEDIIYFFAGHLYLNRQTLMFTVDNFVLDDLIMLRHCSREEIA